MAGAKGRSGRRPKPLKLHKLEGTDRRDRHKNIPEPPVMVPDKPKGLSKLASQTWDNLMDVLIELKMIARCDFLLLEAICIEWGKYKNFNNKIRVMRSGLTESTKGTKMLHPYYKASDKALTNVVKLCQEFGLSAASRSRLNVEAASTAEDPLAKLIRQQNEKRRHA